MDALLALIVKDGKPLPNLQFDDSVLVPTGEESLVQESFEGLDYVLVMRTRVIAQGLGETSIRLSPTLAKYLPSNQSREVKLNIEAASSERPTASSLSRTLPRWDSTPAANPADYLDDGNLIAKFSARQGVLADRSGSGDQSLRVVLVRSPKFGRLQLNENGAFEYRPNLTLDGQDSFDFVVVNAAGTSEVRTVQLIGRHPPVVKLQVAFTDELGRNITTVKQGSIFYLNVSVAGASFTYPWEYDPNQLLGLRFTMLMTSGELKASGAHVSNPAFSRPMLALETDANGQLHLITRQSDSKIAVDGSRVAIDSEGLLLSQLQLKAQELSRVPVTAEALGDLQLELETVMINGVPSRLIELDIAKLIVVETSQLEETSKLKDNVKHLDVNIDGSITALDALVGINVLNQSSLGVKISQAIAVDYHYDTNGDNHHDALDVLLVVNYLNAVGVPEGESASTASHPENSMYYADAFVNEDSTTSDWNRRTRPGDCRQIEELARRVGTKSPAGRHNCVLIEKIGSTRFFVDDVECHWLCRLCQCLLPKACSPVPFKTF